MEAKFCTDDEQVPELRHKRDAVHPQLILNDVFRIALDGIVGRAAHDLDFVTNLTSTMARGDLLKQAIIRIR